MTELRCCIELVLRRIQSFGASVMKFNISMIVFAIVCF